MTRNMLEAFSAPLDRMTQNMFETFTALERGRMTQITLETFHAPPGRMTQYMLDTPVVPPFLFLRTAVRSYFQFSFF